MRKFYSTGKSYTTKGLAGLKSKRAGQDAETLLEAQGDIYASQNRARIWKRHEPYRRLGGSKLKGGAFRAVYTGRAGCDYQIMLSDGRGGLLELKSRSGARIRIDAIDDVQRQELSQASEWGHLALIVVRLSGEWFVVLYENWEHAHRKSHTIKQLLEIGHQIPVVGGLPDILRVFEGIIEG